MHHDALAPVSGLTQLVYLDLTNNPRLNKEPQYRTQLIARGRALTLLDGRQVEQTNRILAQQISLKRSQSASRGSQQTASASYCQESGDETNYSTDND